MRKRRHRHLIADRLCMRHAYTRVIAKSKVSRGLRFSQCVSEIMFPSCLSVVPGRGMTSPAAIVAATVRGPRTTDLSNDLLPMPETVDKPATGVADVSHEISAPPRTGAGREL